ncbi:hypothetical protein Pmani_028965 [Petrolisthes manimaculis]|uniref:Uncharacterized protein n=1 Tax=Petrolisthes manimaculis TaxID=1843537 RepID=A0AAE1TUY7_9EUCA|nr:hypothetical protein Pmani_028965 [Petrolisthes manimaculis]
MREEEMRDGEEDERVATTWSAEVQVREKLGVRGRNGGKERDMGRKERDMGRRERDMGRKRGLKLAYEEGKEEWCGEGDVAGKGRLKEVVWGESWRMRKGEEGEMGSREDMKGMDEKMEGGIGKEEEEWEGERDGMKRGGAMVGKARKSEV